MNIDVVIVTFNRLEKLKKTLSCYESQTVPFRNLIVVNNHSSDGTYEFLEEWKTKSAPFTKYIITTDDNLGGAGGFYAGEKFAMSLNPDWIFVADDDAYPALDMIEKFLDFADSTDTSKLSAICAAVYNPDGTIDISHRSSYELDRGRYFNWISSSLEDYKSPYFKIDFLSYVGSFLNVMALKEVGLIDNTFFIYNDDSEHSLRLKHYGDIVCVPKINITHDVKKVAQVDYQVTDSDILVTWGDYYTNRNEMVMFRRHFPELARYRFKSAIKRHLKGKDKSPYDKVKWIAQRDAWIGKMGKHNKFKPGWSIKNTKKTD